VKFPDLPDDSKKTFGFAARRQSRLTRRTRPKSGPPFHFFVGDWGLCGEESFKPCTILPTSQPLDIADLPGQDNLVPGAEDDEDWMPEEELDTLVQEGWRGAWATALVDRKLARKLWGPS